MLICLTLLYDILSEKKTSMRGEVGPLRSDSPTAKPGFTRQNLVLPLTPEKNAVSEGEGMYTVGYSVIFYKSPKTNLK